MAESRSLLKVVRVVAELNADAELVAALVDAEIIHLEHDREGEVLISPEDAERLRLVQVLTRELDVNLAGVEVILHMRESMVAMRKQVEEILEAVTREVRQRSGR